ncbi:MAG: ribonuclease E/G [Ignavibacteria bacterium CG_4_8_14_3_um_filter_37_9]|nr:Rne/Rng family ribonuclease [Ignavibacteria bacterium]OIO20476.1 MAG: ribonuclease G [Ignavibacteria bacterium CG1_02_37_35]PIP79131.1 MAG: ribonuclease G [Ignavibacteria bacterium CG22_combo_CG10-13_8_21_14_all_37_15]PIS44595.1 MAG: ribonuclease E/G [Ignavibacteria bacterium CG08_land_8_20_14_0_20_37_9]PIW98986.1 MAG: ribonuclease E/G [Ignavibacteria bacterium CG_4_8_14_3_um_filter_37_9]PIX95412.1 MAG: ribonuclease E/G [Ignavibacteria bacterium CG_4_10_14_3_um_filter_37_18]PJC57460.1 MAG:
MVKEIIINSSASQTRVAITEDGTLVDFFVDYPENRRMVGDIYLGKVARVLPGIRAAFINIGMKHDAFLHFSDIGMRTKDFQSLAGDDSDVDIEEDIEDSPNSPQPAHQDNRLINGVPKLKKGEEIVIQITKEPVSNKGVRVSTSVSIPGRFCVLLPFDNKVGISKRITDFKERKRLRTLARGILPPHFGLIIRTVAKNQSEEALLEDLNLLKKTWEKIEEAIKTEQPPALVYQDLNTTSSVIRDLFTADISKVIIDSKKLYKQIKDYVELVHPDLAEKVEFYKSKQSVFEAFKIEEQIKTLFGRKVPMKSGGYLIIEHTEAMVVIDVNSGRYAANKEQELNSLKTDLEAAREISRQLRLRDIGGLIVIDFIDLEDDKNRKKIYDEMKKEFRRDRAKVSLLPMSDFGLVEITRQRIRQNIIQMTYEQCAYCAGTGLLTKKSHVLHDIEEWIGKHKINSSERTLILKCHPSIASKLNEGLFSMLFKLQLKNFLRIKVVEDNLLSMHQYRFYSKKDKTDITN